MSETKLTIDGVMPNELKEARESLVRFYELRNEYAMAKAHLMKIELSEEYMMAKARLKSVEKEIVQCYDKVNRILNSIKERPVANC